MRWALLFALTSVILICFSCAPKIGYVGSHADSISQCIPSSVLRLEWTDTTGLPLGECKGKVYGLDSSARRLFSYPLDKASIVAINLRSNDFFEAVCDKSGKYQLFLAPGSYRLTVSAYGYLSIYLQTVRIEKGDVVILDCALGKTSFCVVPLDIDLPNDRFTILPERMAK